MKFFLLINTEESKELHPGDEGWEDLWNAYVKLDTDAKEAGVLLDSQPFGPPATARTVTVAGESAVVRDGPALPHAMQPAGYYLLECASEADAIRWAQEIPAARTGMVEVRAIFEPG